MTRDLVHFPRSAPGTDPFHESRWASTSETGRGRGAEASRSGADSCPEVQAAAAAAAELPVLESARLRRLPHVGGVHIHRSGAALVCLWNWQSRKPQLSRKCASVCLLCGFLARSWFGSCRSWSSACHTKKVLLSTCLGWTIVIWVRETSPLPSDSRSSSDPDDLRIAFSVASSPTPSGNPRLETEFQLPWASKLSHHDESNT